MRALPASSCTPQEYKGQGDPDVLIATDFPMQGSSRTQTLQIGGATRICSTSRAGRPATQDRPPGLRRFTRSSGEVDPDKCSRNAHAYAQNASLVGVIGTFNSGCAAIEIPVMNQAPGGGLLLLPRRTRTAA